MKKSIVWLKMPKKTLKQIKRREEVDLRNEADSLVFQVEKQLLTLATILVKKINLMRKAKDALKSALEGQDIEDIKAKKKNLKSNSRFISKSISTSSTSSATSTRRCSTNSKR